MTGFLALVADLVLCAAVAEACTRRIARRHQQQDKGANHA